MYEDEKERRKNNRKLYIYSGIILTTVVLFGMSFTHEGAELMLGWIWDYDIKQQLLKANDQALNMKGSVAMKNNEELQEVTEVRMRLTYDNTEMTEIRVERAIEIFYELFPDPQKNSYMVEVTEDKTVIEFVWEPKKTSGLLLPTADF